MTSIAYFSFGHVDVTLPLVKHFHQRGLNVEFIFVFQSSNLKESVFNFEKSFGKVGFIPKEEVENQIPWFVREYLGPAIELIRVFIYPNFKFFDFKNIKYNLALSAYVKSKNIIHISGAGLFIWDLWISRFKELIITIHDFKSHPGESSRIRISELLERLRFKYADSLIIQNRDDFEKLKGKRNQVYFIPFSTLDFLKTVKENENKQHFSFIFFGRISEYKGLVFLLEAFKKILKKRPAATLCIAGSGNSETLLEFSKTNNVSILNRFLSYEEISGLLINSDITICPYVDATQSGVAMTSLTLNVPVIATEIRGFRDVIIHEKNGLLVKPGDSEALYNAMIRTFEQPELIVKMKENINSTLNELGLNWNIISSSLINIYKIN